MQPRGYRAQHSRSFAPKAGLWCSSGGEHAVIDFFLACILKRLAWYRRCVGWHSYAYARCPAFRRTGMCPQTVSDLWGSSFRCCSHMHKYRVWNTSRFLRFSAKTAKVVPPYFACKFLRFFALHVRFATKIIAILCVACKVCRAILWRFCSRFAHVWFIIAIEFM